MSSTWMEDFVHDDINDYYYYLPSLFNNFDLPFYTTNGIKEYGQGIFIHMLVEKYGNKVVKDIWEAYVTREALDAIDFALQSHGSSLKNEMADFTIWNYFTGNRADTVNYYPEGKHYPEFDPEQELTVNSSLDITDTVKKQSFNYYQITPDFTASYYIQPAFANPENWMFSVIVDPQTSTRDFFTNVYSGNAVANLAQVSSISKMFICPIYANIPEPGDYYNSETFAMEIVKGVGMDSNSEILIVKPNPFLVGKHDDVKIIFNLNETSDAKATIYTEHGIKVKEITELCPSGTNEFKWDGTNEDGEGVVSGVYLVIIEANTILGPEKIALIR